MRSRSHFDFAIVLFASLALDACGDDSSSSASGAGGAGGATSSSESGDRSSSGTDGQGSDADVSSSSSASSDAASTSGTDVSTSASSGGPTFTADVQTPEPRVVASAVGYLGVPAGEIFIRLTLEGGAGPGDDSFVIVFDPAEASVDGAELPVGPDTTGNRVVYVGDDPQLFWNASPGETLLVRHHGAVGDVLDVRFEGSMQHGDASGTSILYDVVVDVQVPRGPDQQEN